jgi:hypothetical protein
LFGISCLGFPFGVWHLVLGISSSLRLYINFFQPVSKLMRKNRHGAKVYKIYDTAQAPYQRLLNSEVLTEEKKCELADMCGALNPVILLQQIRPSVEQLHTLAER